MDADNQQGRTNYVLHYFIMSGPGSAPDRKTYNFSAENDQKARIEVKSFFDKYNQEEFNRTGGDFNKMKPAAPTRLERAAVQIASEFELTGLLR